MTILQRMFVGVRAALPYAAASTAIAVVVSFLDPEVFSSAERPTPFGLVAFYFIGAVSSGAVWGLLHRWATTLGRQTLASIPTALPVSAVFVIGLVHRGDISQVGRIDMWIALLLPLWLGPVGLIAFHLLRGGFGGSRR